MTAIGILALCALSIVVGSLGYLHLAPTGLSPVRNAVSQYGITTYRDGYRVATLAFGAAGLFLAVGVDQRLGVVVAVTILLLVFALSRAAISWYPMDAPGAEPTETGRLHGLLAVVAFGGISLAALYLGRVLARRREWHALSGVSSVLGWLMVATLLAMALARSSPAVRDRFGLIERAFYAFAIAWSVIFATACALNVR